MFPLTTNYRIGQKKQKVVMKSPNYLANVTIGG